jgi:hypothetical protein
LAMPVELFRRVGVVENIDDDPLPLSKTNQWARKLPIFVLRPSLLNRHAAAGS